MRSRGQEIEQPQRRLKEKVDAPFLITEQIDRTMKLISETKDTRFLYQAIIGLKSLVRPKLSDEDLKEINKLIEKKHDFNKLDEILDILIMKLDSEGFYFKNIPHYKQSSSVWDNYEPEKKK